MKERSYDRPYKHIKVAQGVVKRKDNNRHKLNRILRIIKNNGQIVVKIVLRTDIEEEAVKYEIYLISKYGRRDLNNGTLTNLTGGGEGGSGRVWSEESKNKLKKTFMIRGYSMAGKRHRKESIEKMRLYQKNRPAYPHSEDCKKLISEIRKRDYRDGTNPFVELNKKNSKPVVQIDINGNVIKEWPSCNAASKNLKISRGYLQEVLKRPDNRPLLAKGFYWKYPENVTLVNNKLKDIDYINKLRIDATSKKL